MERPFNFSAGPAILPLEVLERASEAVKQQCSPSQWRDDQPLEERLSVIEISHRSKTFDAIHNQAIERVHQVLGVPTSHQVLLLQGGATLQFACVPLNLREAGKPMAYIDTGAWSVKAIKEAKALGEVEVLASSEATGYDRIPDVPGVETYRGASYVHVTTNNTIFGTEYPEIPQLAADVPLVSDLSSHIGSRPMPLERLAVGYAGAQKNLGPSGLTLVFVRKDLLQRAPASHVPTLLRWSAHAEKNSLLNTINTFGVFVLNETLAWLERQGGLDAMGEHNRRKANKLYALLDESSLFVPHAQPNSRSLMNVTWTLASAGEDNNDRTARFLEQAQAAGLCGLKGHRSVGGCRASIYNAMPEAGVDALCAFMREFERTQA